MPHASPYRLHDLFFKESCTSSHILAALVGAGVGTAIVTVTLWSKLVATQVLRYADTNFPLVDTPDAYFFLYRAQEMLAHGLEWSSVSALSTLLALLHKLTWLPLEVSAFWLPVVLGVACGLCYALWGRLLGLSAPLSGLAALAGTLSPAFASRVHGGNLDTDGLIFFLLPLCLHTLARLSLPGEDIPSAGLAQGSPADRGLSDFLRSPAGRRTRLWCRLLVLGGLLGWLWFPALLILPFGLWIWALTWPWAQSGRERRLRKTLALAVPLLGIPFLLVTPDVLPAGVQALREHVLESMGFVANPRADVIYQSIAELQNMTPAAWLTGLGGNVAGGLLMVVAFVLLVWRSPRKCLFLLPLLLLQAAAYASNRFLFFGVLPMALGVAALPQTLPALLQGLATRCPLSIAWGGRSLSMPRAGNVGCVLALCAVCALVFLENRQQTEAVASTSLGRAEDQIGLALSRVIRAHRDKGETVALMHWWDEGYYLRYRTGVPVFFDGGSQSPLPAFIAARGFAIDHPQLARLWMRYFALHGGKGHTGWDPLVAAWGDEQTALNALSALFLLPEDKRDEQLKTWPALRVGGKDTPVRTLTTLEDRKAWLFPRGHVFIFLPLRFLSISPWWMAMGDRLHSDMSLVRNHLEILPRSAVTYDAGAGRLGLPQAMLDKGYKSGTVIAPTPEKPFGFPWGAEQAEPLVILPAPSPFCFITNRLLARTTAFRLLAPSCENIPGFVPVAVNFAAAGAWEVLE